MTMTLSLIALSAVALAIILAGGIGYSLGLTVSYFRGYEHGRADATETAWEDAKRFCDALVRAQEVA